MMTRTTFVLGLTALNLVITPMAVHWKRWGALARWNWTVAGCWAGMATLNFARPYNWGDVTFLPVIQIGAGNFHWMVGHLYWDRVFRPRRRPPRWDGTGEYP